MSTDKSVWLQLVFIKLSLLRKRRRYVGSEANMTSISWKMTMTCEVVATRISDFEWPLEVSIPGRRKKGNGIYSGATQPW